MAHRSFDPNQQDVVLPMSRYDIADYLAISVETVSRALTELKRRGIIPHLGQIVACRKPVNSLQIAHALFGR
jgi:CRP-like cAMP-binding protein